MLEFNELSPRLMQRFIGEGVLPNFRRFRDESVVVVTDPEESQDGLEPWIQWVTVHTGTSREEHGLEKLGEANRLNVPTIGQQVTAAGGSVWMCGSMNLPRSAAGGGWFLPDPWNPDSAPDPEDLRAFSDFVRANVQEHSNSSADVLTPRALSRFGWFLSRRGLRASTVRDAVKQLLDERRGERGAWARASVLDRLQWDLFRWRWEKDHPQFATFFSNSTAHYQHVFWRNLEPERFVHAPGEEEQKRHGGAIRFGYEQMDRLVGEALDLADRSDATLVLCTALSQQPYLEAEQAGGKYIHRPHSFDAVLDALGICDVQQVAPVMAEQFHLFFADESSARAAKVRVDEAVVDGVPAFTTRLVGSDLFVGCSIHEPLSSDAQLVSSAGEVRFQDLFYRSDTAKSGFHHPDGMWWIRTGRHRELSNTVSLRSVAPTLLGLMDVPVPESMTAAPLALGLS